MKVCESMKPINQLSRSRLSMNMLKDIIKPISQKIINELSDGKKLIVSDLWRTLDIEQSAISQKLSILENHGLIIKTRQGRNMFVELNIHRFEKVVNAINKFLIRES